MNQSIIEKINQLDKKLDYHAYSFELEERYAIPSLIETLENTLDQKERIISVPDIALSFRDVIETLHQINSLLINEKRTEIDRDFFGTDTHLSVTYNVTVIIQSLLDCHWRFKLRDANADILSMYAWVLTEVWHQILCQDCLDVWEDVKIIVVEKLEDYSEEVFQPLLKVLPPNT